MAELRTVAPERHVMAVLQCAGNRRSELQEVAPTSGNGWRPGAIGHARWTGVPLAAVLALAQADAGCGHVAFESMDCSHETGQPFGVSIGMGKALSADVLLAWAMNGEGLRPEHGAPVRLVVPGYAGVRSPKWLRRITVQDQPSDNPMQARDYRLVPPDATEATVDWERAIVIDEMPVNAAICSPARDGSVPAGRVAVRGYATASARTITRVDVSADGGRTWRQAELRSSSSVWSWTLWSCTLDLPPGLHELAVRAWDSAGQTQPARTDDLWNFKGYLCNAWHRVVVEAR